MYKYILFSVIGLLLSTTALASKQDAFKIGEELKYALYYNSTLTGNVTAGEVVTSVRDHKSTQPAGDKLHIVLEGRTKGAFRWFFKADDSYETFVDCETMLPFYFKQRLNEGSYRSTRDVAFEQQNGKIMTTNNKNNDVRHYTTTVEVQDLLSMLYYIRNWNFDNIYPNQLFNVNLFMSDSVYNIEFKYQGLETVKTSLGKISCMKFAPRVVTGGVFADETPMIVYVSNDRNRVPILAESELYIGRARMELISHKNLRYPLKIE